MIKQIYYSSLLGILLLILSCSTFQVQPDQSSNEAKYSRTNPLINGLNETIDFANIQEKDILQATKNILRNADVILEEILFIPDSLRSFENTLLRLDDLYNIISKVWNPLSLLSSVSNIEAIRKASDDSSLRIQQYYVELAANAALFKAVLAYSQTIEAQTLQENRKRFLESELRDFKHSGHFLSVNKREQLKKIQIQLSELSMNFENNIISHVDTIFITEELMAGLPDDYIQERYQPDGSYAIDLSYPSFYPFMENAESDSIRKLLRYKFLNKAMPDNLIILNDIIALRKMYSEILGYSSYAAYVIEEGMAKTPDAVWQFENDLKDKIQNKANWDTSQLLEIKRLNNDASAAIVFDWEKYYYENELLLREYNVDNEKVKQYFEMDNVIDGFFVISQILFGIKYREVEEPSVWHEEVRMFEMLEKSTGDKIGVFYLDLYPRENKYQHAAEFTIISGKKIGDQYQLPMACLVCNFPRSTASKPSLLPHDDVETFFHEFGHLLHDLLSTSELSSQAGTSVAMDFVEAPSQMLENWVWNKQSLSMFARHYKTGDIIPDSLLNRMISARNLQSGNDLLQQIFYGMLDMTLHDNFEPSESQSITDVVIELQNTITHFPHIDGTYQEASFGHLMDYSASYYGYLWSEVYASDMFSIFEENGVLNSDIGYQFRKSIFEKGGGENPMNLVKEFLGREPNNAAFLKRQGISEYSSK